MVVPIFSVDAFSSAPFTAILPLSAFLIARGLRMAAQRCSGDESFGDCFSASRRGMVSASAGSLPLWRWICAAMQPWRALTSCGSGACSP